MKYIKKISSVLMTAALAMTYVLPVHAQTERNEAFDEWMQEQFVESMESDYTSMHFYVKDYRAMGITKPEVNFGTVSLEGYQESIEEGQKTLDQLVAFDYNSLSDDQKHDYDAILYAQEKIVELNKYPLMDFAFDPSNSVVDNMHTLLTEFVFYEKEDFEDYLTLLQSGPDYLEQALALTKAQAAEGYFLNEAALDQEESEIDKFVKNTDNNPLVVIFNKNVDAFEGLTDAEKEDLKSRNEEYVLNTYIPFVQYIRDSLEELRGSRQGGDAVADLKDGKEYYDARLRYITGLDRSPEEILDIVGQYVDLILPQYIAVLMTMDESAEAEQVDLADAEEILNYLKAHLSDFPNIPATTFTVSYLDPSLASDSIGAYYLVPPVDDYGNNVIKVNGSNVDDMNNLYYYLAHEGYPGHLYAHTWSHEDGEQPLRSVLSFLGYGEGWAMYASGQMWSQSGLSDDAIELNRLDWDLNYALMAAVDIGVNGIGWTVKDVAEYLDDLGLNSSIAKDLYDSACETPGSIVPYGVGLAFMDLLRYKAETALGNDFDVVEYHEAVLKYGERSLDALEKDVEQWLSEKNVSIDNGVITPTSNTSSTPILIGIGAAVVLVLAIAVIMRSRSKKKDPFNA